MPERGQVLRESDRGRLISAATGESTSDDSPIWSPWIVGLLNAAIPADLRDGGREVQALPAVGAVGPDHVYEYYVFRQSRRVETRRRSLILGPDDDFAEIIAQRGGRPRLAVMVFRLVGEPRTTPDGAVYDAEPCFRFRLDVGPDGEPSPPLLGAIGWLVHHRDQRGAKLDIEWDGGARLSGPGYAEMPDWEARLDQPTHEVMFDVEPPSSTSTSGPAAPSGPPSGASDVLPSARPRGRLFRRGR